MDKQQFMSSFVTSFLATWCANNYNDACLSGEPQRLYNPPVEDAEDIANEVYLHCKEREVF